ncbi:hypothetical protein HanXRQr2_Chr16g0754881 [Helianthus annuus]|uniref:Uncharacterized protein n=1 Tax=Helianthus annuus TaxID=4232 RepID=A0A251S0H8_HELAN|nr:hypothetical protein HanXRQr2_Chr16g0754881 [Helianthus annuus]KAJ0821722.1 hypothetical protein HanPSC8_Chr16g0723571 [Helianthus annuus]
MELGSRSSRHNGFEGSNASHNRKRMDNQTSGSSKQMMEQVAFLGILHIQPQYNPDVKMSRVGVCPLNSVV